jgi:hypothetical protein
MVVNFATRRERRWRFRVAAMVGEAYLRVKVGSVSPPRSSVPRVSARAEDERARASLLHMAQVWFRLAEERVNEADERQLAES